MTALTPAGTVRCILCHGTVSYKSQNSKKFESHMKNEHDAYFNLEFMLTACLMNPDERDSVKDLIGKQHEEEQTALDISPHDLPPTPTSLPDNHQPRIPAPAKRRAPETPSETPRSKRLEIETDVVVKQEMTEEVNAEITFECVDCRKRFPTRRNLQSHQKRHGHGAKNKRSQTPSSSLSTPKTPTPSPPLVSPSSTSSSLITAQNFSSIADAWVKNFQLTVKQSPSNTNIKEEPVEENVTLEETQENITETQRQSPEPLLNENESLIKDDATDGHDEFTDILTKSKYFRENPDTISRLFDHGFLLEQFTSTDEMLPEGFRYKSVKSRGKEVGRVFLTPGQTVLQSSLAVLEWMRLRGETSAEKIRILAEHLGVSAKMFQTWIEDYIP